jgi:hypothetical protein
MADVSLLDLQCLDLLCWLGGGSLVSELLHISESSVSRRSRACAANLGLVLSRKGGSYSLIGNASVLASARRFLGELRGQGLMPLRLECRGLSESVQSHLNALGNALVYVPPPEDPLQASCDQVASEMIDFIVMPSGYFGSSMIDLASCRSVVLSSVMRPVPLELFASPRFLGSPAGSMFLDHLANVSILL